MSGLGAWDISFGGSQGYSAMGVLEILPADLGWGGGCLLCTHFLSWILGLLLAEATSEMSHPL